MYVTNEEFDTYITRINQRFEDLSGKILTLNFKVESLTVQMQHMAEALKLELPYTSNEQDGQAPRTPR